MKYWLHRITGGENGATYSYPLLFNHNILSIGWSDFSEDEFLKNVLTKGMSAIEKRMSDEGWDKPRNRFSLWRFIGEMQPGDWVVVPTYGGNFSVFEIADAHIFTNESSDAPLGKDFLDYGENYAPRYNQQDGYLYDKDDHYIDLGFYREVKPVATNISRADYADQALISRMKVPMATLDITDIKDSVIHAVEWYKANKPINIKESLTDKLIPEMLRIIKELADADKFEQLVQAYFATLGAEVITPAKNDTADGDADKVAVFENIKTRILVQVKKHDGTTNEWAIQQIRDFKANHDFGDGYSTQLWVVSTCDNYSEEAELEATDANVCLIDGKEFCRMLLNAGLKGLTL